MSLSDAPDPGLRDMPLFDTPAGPPGAERAQAFSGDRGLIRSL